MLDKIFSNESWSLYKAFSMVDQQSVLIKTLMNPTPYNSAQLIHDYYLTKDIVTNGVFHPIKLEKHLGHPYVVIEPFSGEPLSDILENKTLEMSTTLKLAIRLSTILIELQQSKIIHNALCTDNIFVNLKTNEMKLTGFHKATKIATQNDKNIGLNVLKAQAGFMAPEQTGRINRTVDQRADLYSLGVILYNMLTSFLPFQTSDIAELIHAHLAKMPKPPHELNRNIPMMVSHSVMKLLSKTPESRYQSAYGLKEDLETCMSLLNLKGTISPFELGQKDTPVSFKQTNKLYGRAKETKEILESFHRTRKGRAEFLLIHGPSGIGKTALVDTLQIPLIGEKGYVISGKFSQIKNQIPFAPFIHAFRGLLKQILSEDSCEIKKWKNRLVTELSTYIGVITDFIPEVAWLVGPQKSVHPLPSFEAQNRLQQAIQKFVGVFAKENHPLVLFLDDLQWADSATLNLVSAILVEPKARYLLIVGAYRDNEVGVGHPLPLMIKECQERGGHLTNLPLRQLGHSFISEWISEVLSIESKEADPLADTLLSLSQGNPFFITQLFDFLYEQGALSYLPETKKWQLDFGQLKQSLIQNTILDFMVKRLEQLPSESQQVLESAACLGHQFDLKTLSIILDLTYFETSQRLGKALELGFILPLDQSYQWVFAGEDIPLMNDHPPEYRFLHDRVQQACYMTMSDECREKAHKRIGMELLKQSSDEQLEENIFEIVNHLNICRGLLSEHEKGNLAEWNWLAGERARKGTAFDSALSYFVAGQDLLPPNSWQTNFDLCFKMMIGLGECYYLNHQFSDAETHLNDALAHSRTRYDKLKVISLKITLYTHIHQVRDATNSGLAGLKLFGLNLPRSPGKGAVAKEFILTKMALRKRTAEDLERLPAMTGKDERLFMQTLINTNAPTYHVDQNLATILMLRALRFTLKHGNTDLTALVYNNYALALSAGFSDFNSSYDFGKLAIQLVEKRHDVALQARVYFVFGSFVNHWKNHITYNLHYLERSQQCCIESGNLHLAGANSSFIGLTLFLMGKSLEDTKVGIDKQLQFIQQIDSPLPRDFLNEISHWIDVLSHPDTEPLWNFVEITEDKSALIMHYTIRLQIAYLLDNKEQAEALLEVLEPLVDNTLVMVIAPDYYFYHALWLAKGNKNQKKSTLFLKKLKRWAKHSPENYLHKYYLVKAEMARDSHDEVIQLYHHAIRLAEENGYIQDMSVANECLAGYYYSKGLPKSAKPYMTAAYDGYQKWGAHTLAQQLRAAYPEIVAETGQEMSDVGNGAYSLDIHSVMQSVQAISGQIKLEKMLSRLMTIVLENAGAESGFLILHREEQLELVATSHVDKGEKIHPRHPEPIDYHKDLSTVIVNYVAKSLEPVVLDDAVREGWVMKDAYIKRKNIRSVLCLPIVYQSQLTGVLYLENNRSSHAFTRDRVDLLTLLSSQAAIAIENAYLYDTLEKKVTERTRLLEATNVKLNDANNDLARSEHARRHLLSNISHDLRSPITAIQGYIEAIMDGLVKSPEQQQTYLERAHKKVLSLSGLIHDVFELAQLESGEISFSQEILPVDRFLHYLCDQFEFEVNESGLDFKWSGPEGDDEDYPLIEVDAGRMEQVISNLMTNAIKHTASGSISMGMSFDKGPERAVISIRDSGVGIPESELPYIFDRFYTKQRGSIKAGHGLGLAICKEIVTFHNGSIWAESSEGVGTTFYIALPVMAVSAGALS